MIPEEALAGIVNTYSQAIVLLMDSDGKICASNQAAETLLPLDDGSLTINDLVIDFHRKLTLSELQLDGSKGSILSLKTRAGKPVSRRFRFFKWEDQILAYGDLEYDEIEKLQYVISDTNKELANTIRQLHKANSELRELNKFKNELLGMAAHDLRSPIANIKYAAHLIKTLDGKSLSDPSKEYLDIINSMGGTMLHMLEEMLDLTEMDSGNLVMRFDDCSLEGLIYNSIALHKPEAEKKHIQIDFNFDESIPEINGDFLKLVQVFNNFISNAIKYSHPDTTVTITALNENDEAHVIIEDRGQGIPREEIGNLFKPFSKTSVETTAGEKSTGLGLAIVKKIVTAHGGRVSAESEVGIGTKMHVQLPIIKAKETA